MLFCSLFWGCCAGMHVCVSRVLFPNLVKTLKSESILSLFAEMWVVFFFYYFFSYSFFSLGPGLAQLCPQGHSGWLGRKQLWPTNLNCEIQSIILHWSCKSFMSLLMISAGLFSWISACVLHGQRPHCIFYIAFTEALSKLKKPQNFIFLILLISISLY